MPNHSFDDPHNLTQADIDQVRKVLQVDPPPFTTGLDDVDGDITLDRGDGFFQQVVLTGATVARTLNEIANPVEGKMLKVRIVSEAADNVDRTLTLDASQVLPDEYAGPNPITLPGGHSRTLQFYCTGTQWELQSIGGAYTLPPA